MSRDIKDELSVLFQAAGPAYHQAYLETDGEDPEWPLWYAKFLHHDVNDLLADKLTLSEVVYMLVAVERAYRQEQPTVAWHDYDANFFLEDDGQADIPLLYMLGCENKLTSCLNSTIIHGS